MCVLFLQMAGIISAVMVMIVILALGHLLEPLQKVRKGINDNAECEMGLV